jgi:hypothetical protein
MSGWLMGVCRDGNLKHETKTNVTALLSIHETAMLFLQVHRLRPLVLPIIAILRRK